MQQFRIGKAAKHRTFHRLCRYSQIEQEDHPQGSDREDTKETRNSREIFGSSRSAKIV